MPASNVEVKVTYTRNSYGYTVNYYKDSVTEANKLGTTSGTAEFESGIIIPAGTSEGQLNWKKPIGYQNGVQQGTVPYVIQVSENVINVLYTKDGFAYTINYYQRSVSNENLLGTTSGTAEFGSGITIPTGTAEGQLNWKQPSGYNGGVQQGTVPYIIKISGNVIDVVYTRRSNPPVIIDDPEVPLAELEKLDHFAYVIGYPDGEVKPQENITREEVAMIFYRLLTDESRNNLLSDTNTFTDIMPERWSNRAISTLYNAGIIKGYPDGTFKPSDPISRAEFATIAAKFDKLELNNTSKFTDIFGHWAEKYITSSEIKGWIKGYPDMTFKPEKDITRAEAMTLINNVLERAVPEENIHPNAMFWPDMESDDWYYEAVMEATNSHDYIYEEDKDELWTGMKPNKVWP